jgi:hypothetical protein
MSEIVSLFRQQGQGQMLWKFSVLQGSKLGQEDGLYLSGNSGI